MKRLLATLLMILMAAQAWAIGAPVRIDGGENITAQNDVTVTTTATLVAASNSNRAALNCTTTAAVRWGGSTITSTKGQLLPANASIEVKNTASVYMIAESSDATVSCTEETWTAVSSGSGVFSP